MLSLVVDVIIAITKFTHGAWVIVVLVPIMVVFLVRLARQYEIEADALESDVPKAVAAPILRRHIVLVFVDRLDMASARAIQYARTLRPDELRAVHFVLDQQRAHELAQAWTEHSLSPIALDLVECPDRRLTRCAVEVVARDLAGGDTEVSVLMPDRKYRGFWHRILHDQTADAIERDVSQLDHANVTTVPFHFGNRRTARDVELTSDAPVAPSRREPALAAAAEPQLIEAVTAVNGSQPIGSVLWRQRVRIEGRVRIVRVQPLAGSASLELVLEDDTGALSIVFIGRRRLAGVDVGTRMRVEGTAGMHHGRLAIFNPVYELLIR